MTDLVHKPVRLFVYGTLAPGRANHHILSGCAGTWESATLRGHLLDQGWGASMGYPGIVPSADGDVVEGYLLTSEYLPDHWNALDSFEGGAYARTSVQVQLAGGATVPAFVYALAEADSRPETTR
ncbi:MAG: gamma-glutamylcyclotransferase family protein [Pseudomonadota bacterium]